MFFAIDLLCPQHGGKFSIAWICATRGVHASRRKLILDCNVIKLCDDILQMVMSASNRPKLRMSLSLSARLIYGTVKIYREQVKELEADVVKCLVLGFKRTIISELDVSSQPMPVPKVSKKRKKRNIVSNEASLIIAPPDFLNQDLENIVNNMARTLEAEGNVAYEEHITIREEASRQSNMELDNLRGLGDFGVIEDVILPQLPDTVSRDITILQQKDDTPKTPTKRRSTRNRSDAAKKSSINPTDIEHTDIQQLTIEPEPIPQTEIPTVIQEEVVVEQPLVSVEEAILVQEPRIKKTKTATIAKTLIKARVPRFVNIDRTSFYDEEEFDRGTYEQVPIQLLKPKLDYIVNLPLLACFINDDFNIEMVLSSVRASPRTRTSLLKSFHMETTQTGIIQTTQMPSIAEYQGTREVVFAEVHPEPTKRKRTDEQILPAVTLNINEIDVQPPSQNIGLYTTVIEDPNLIIVEPSEVTIITEIPPAASSLKAPIIENFIPRYSLSVEEIRQRLKTMRQDIKRWYTANQGELTIEDICAKPVNRFNIAVAFNDLLTMHKMEYVKLNNKPNCLELGNIEKGERLFKKKKI